MQRARSRALAYAGVIVRHPVVSCVRRCRRAVGSMPRANMTMTGMAVTGMAVARIQRVVAVSVLMTMTADEREGGHADKAD